MPSAEYLFDEAARFRGYTAWQWVAEPWQCKARVLAHFLEHNLRESYAMEKSTREAEGKATEGRDPTNWARFRRRS